MSQVADYVNKVAMCEAYQSGDLSKEQKLEVFASSIKDLQRGSVAKKTAINSMYGDKAPTKETVEVDLYNP